MLSRYRRWRDIRTICTIIIIGTVMLVVILLVIVTHPVVPIRYYLLLLLLHSDVCALLYPKYILINYIYIII